MAKLAIRTRFKSDVSHNFSTPLLNIHWLFTRPDLTSAAQHHRPDGVLCAVEYKLKHTATLFSLSDHYILSREWRVIVDQAQTNFHGRPMVLYTIRCDRAADYEGSSLWSDVF